MPGSQLTILHLAPHPDDESIGAPATLLELRAAGHHVINYPCSFGREEQVETRRVEVEEACRRAGFELDREIPTVERRRSGLGPWWLSQESFADRMHRESAADGAAPPTAAHV